VFSRAWVEPIAHALVALGTKHAWVVHGSDGLDEITGTGLSYAAEVKNGTVRIFEIDPRELGLICCKAEDLKGGDGSYNAAALLTVLNGIESAYRDVSVLNAAAGIVVAGRAETLGEAIILARTSIDSGEAKARLERLIEVSNS
jgi:anthranilate phosphoribosyltransferase